MRASPELAPPRRRVPRGLPAAALALAVAATYAASLGNGFVYDDHEVILAQAPPRSAADLLAVFAEPHFLGLPYYRPVTRATLLVQKALHGDRAPAYHAANIALMALAAVLASAMLRTRALGVDRAPAWLAAAIFALHPAASACVYPIASGRETSLPAVLSLAAVAAYLRGGRSGRALAALAFAAALFAKEQAVAVPLAFAAADALALAPAPPRGAAAWLRRYAPLAPIALVWLFARLALFGGGELELAVVDEPGGPLLSLLYGLQTAVAPTADVVYEPEVAIWLSPARLALAAVVVTGLAFGARALDGTGRRRLAFWGVWFALFQLPTANWLLQEARFAERYVFLSALAVPAAAATLVTTATRRSRARRAALACGAALALACAAVSAGRARTYADDAAFAAQWLRTNPASPEAHHLTALALARGGDPVRSLHHLREAVRLAPRDADARHNLGIALAGTGARAEARAAFEETLRLAPDHPEAHVALGSLLAAEGRLEQAIAHYHAALRRAPHLAEAHNNLGTALARRGDAAGAERALREALRLRPDYADAHANLALLLEAEGRRAEAARHAAAAARLRSGGTGPGR